MSPDEVATLCLQSARPTLYGEPSLRSVCGSALAVLVSLAVEREGVSGPDAARAVSSRMLARYGPAAARSPDQHAAVLRDLCAAVSVYSTANGVSDRSVAHSVRVVCAGRGKRAPTHTVVKTL